MPVIKTTKRALRASNRKAKVNNVIRTNLEVALRIAKKKKSEDKIIKAISLADRAAKKHLIHKNKAAHIKSSLSKLRPSRKTASKSKKSSGKK
jgi:small subunit ribosomal protein S20